MKASVFVCAAAVLFASWLTVTFVNQVRPTDYPSLGRGSVPLSAKQESPASKRALITSEDFKASEITKAEN